MELNMPKDELQQFFEQHNVEQNKFDDFESAEAFFREAGFMVERKGDIDFSQLTALPHFLESVPPERLAKFRDAGKMRETWQLRVCS